MKRKGRDRGGKSAVDILEEATHLLRANVSLLGPYYFGSLPFILGLLYFWTDMSTGADAWSHCSEASWGLALLFIWMKTWQSLYARGLIERIRGEASPGWGLRRMMRAAAIQTVIQPWGILILPIAFIIMLPSVLLSGFMFPRSEMPTVIQWITLAIPVTYFIEILRGVVLRAADLVDLVPQVAGLGACCLIILTVSVGRFRKTL